MDDSLTISDSVPVLDRSRINADFGDDEEILFELKELFLDHSPVLVDEINHNITDQDMDRLLGNARSLKGACATYGASRMALVCQMLIDAVEKNELDKIGVLADILQQEFEAVRSAMGPSSPI